jgi:hypothetical protein
MHLFLDASVAMEKNKIQNKQSSVTSMKWLRACCGNCGNGQMKMFLMMSWKRQMPRGTKFCLKNQKELEKFIKIMRE